MRKRPITLIETLIALALTAMLLSIALSFFGQFLFLQQEAAKQRKENFHALYAQSRLGALFSHLVKKRQTVGQKPETYWFFTTPGVYQPQSTDLIFVTDNDVDADPSFSDLLLARLFLDDQGNLTLATWPPPQRDHSPHPPMRLEVLLPQIADVRYLFYRPPRSDPARFYEDIQGTTAYGRWTAEWPFEEENLPVMMKIFLIPKPDAERSPEPIVFAFVLPFKNKELAVTYQN